MGAMGLVNRLSPVRVQESLRLAGSSEVLLNWGIQWHPVLSSVILHELPPIEAGYVEHSQCYLMDIGDWFRFRLLAPSNGSLIWQGKWMNLLRS